MRDVELLLRYIAFQYFLPSYRGNLKVFLDMTCEIINRDWKYKRNEISYSIEQFDKAVQLTIDIFGEKTFSRMWLSKSEMYRSQFNRAILEDVWKYGEYTMFKQVYVA
jgi:hypothetical protein